MSALPATTRKLQLRRRSSREVAPIKARRGDHSELVRKATADTLEKHNATIRALAKV